MRDQTRRRMWTAVATALALAAAVVPASACPFCSGPQMTLREQVAGANVVVLARWVESRPPQEDRSGSTTFEIMEILKTPEGRAQKGDPVVLPRTWSGTPGDLYLLTGTVEETVRWDEPVQVTETSFRYIAETPAGESTPGERLAYFLKFLQHPEETIANDAYGEFANADYNDIKPLAAGFSRESLRQWLESSETPTPRIGLYAMMLGLCGNADDAEFLKRKIIAAEKEFPLGLDGTIYGYLLLSGAEGLTFIEREKFRSPSASVNDISSALSALRTAWEYAPELPKEQIRRAARALLDREEVAELVIADLARWNDWEIQERLIAAYGTGAFQETSAKVAIVRYLSASERAAKDDADPPEHARRAREYLATVKASEPQIIKQARGLIFAGDRR